MTCIIKLPFFNIKACSLQIIPEVWIGFCHHFGIVDVQCAKNHRSGCKGHGHAMIIVGVYRRFLHRSTTFAIPFEHADFSFFEYKAQLLQFVDQGLTHDLFP